MLNLVLSAQKSGQCSHETKVLLLAGVAAGKSYDNPWKGYLQARLTMSFDDFEGEEQPFDNQGVLLGVLQQKISRQTLSIV
ncbi:hypothetical protein GHK52_03830 [Lactococcus garvieae]|nr:hypothetical protein [Lactococcus garvieae]